VSKYSLTNYFGLPDRPDLISKINAYKYPACLDEREASRASRKRAWKNLQEIRWVLKDAAGMDLPPAVRKTIDLEGRL
jgi:hypothetical protein